MLNHLTIRPAPGRADLDGPRLAREASELGLGAWRIDSARGFLVEGDPSPDRLLEVAGPALVDPVIESLEVVTCPSPPSDRDESTIVYVLPIPGVTDPEADSALDLLRSHGMDLTGCRSVRTYRVAGPRERLDALVAKVLSNSAVEQVIVGPIPLDRLAKGGRYVFNRVEVRLADLDDAALANLSREGQLSLSVAEMRTIQGHFRDQGREPTDVEIETIAQTWSEHCSHKTLRGSIDFDGERIDNLLKSTIFAATEELGLDWLVSVFSDNAGVIRFDEDHDVCFKVETHNHPSAIDPYGGANTGLGGVIRDIMGTGLGARPIANTDVFCVAPPDTPPEAVPTGVIHPRRVLEGIVAGVRDYGNRMGIPTVNGALVADPRYLANPLVFCGTIGVIPRGLSDKRVESGDRIVALGGRTGRDGIHGATFSSADLTSGSESTSGGAVQIGDAIVEKKVLDIQLAARDRGLYRSVTDCGAGGFSSAVGEMAADLGAEVHLERAPLKYEGLSYTEIWISEAQERMVLAVPPEHLDTLIALCGSEDVEATDLGEFQGTGRLRLRYEGQTVADLNMNFLHEGRPRVVRRATYRPMPPSALPPPPDGTDLTGDLMAVLRDWSVASKEWIVRQYDHEVQARTVLKPLVGVNEDGPGDASVILPVRGSTRGLAIGCGLAPRIGDLDPAAMAACAIDEAIRNCVAVGADPARIALLDNFCWGNPERPEVLGSLVTAARACRETAVAYRTPFISGKDSLYNEYVHEGKNLAIPGTLLISAIGIVPDIRRCVSMDFKAAGNQLLLVGETRDELGGSTWAASKGLLGGRPPRLDLDLGPRTANVVHALISETLVRSCHDLSDGGLGTALAESALAGGLGASVRLADLSVSGSNAASLIFSESPARYLLEVEPDREAAAIDLLKAGGVPYYRIGGVTEEPRLDVWDVAGKLVMTATLAEIRAAWIRPLHESSAASMVADS